MIDILHKEIEKHTKREYFFLGAICGVLLSAIIVCISIVVIIK